MSHANELLAESQSCPGYLSSLFLDRLGDAKQEEFYQRAIDLAHQQGLVDIEKQAQAWLAFSVATKQFQFAVTVPATNDASLIQSN
jgi:hypothetical protein